MPRRSGRPRGASISARLRATSIIRFAGCRRFRARCVEIAAGGKAERLKILRTALAVGNGVPGTVLDDQLTIACGEGAVRLVEVQRAGKRPMSTGEFLRGFPLSLGAMLTN